MSFLIIDQYAEQYRQRLSAAFSDRLFVAVPDAGAPGIDFDAVQGLFAFGPAFDDEIIRRLASLQWIQFLSSGTRHALAPAVARPEGDRDVVPWHSRTGGFGDGDGPYADAQPRCAPHPEGSGARRRNRVEQPLLLNKVVTILGTGVIAVELARRCKAMGSVVHGVSSTPRPLEGFDRMFPRSELAAAATLADFLVLLAPLSDQTRGIVDRNVLRGMKPSAYLIRRCAR